MFTDCFDLPPQEMSVSLYSSLRSQDRSPLPRPEETWVRWKDGDSFGARMLFGVLERTFRVRHALRELRSVGGLTWTSLVLLVLAFALQSWILGAAFSVALIAQRWSVALLPLLHHESRA